MCRRRRKQKRSKAKAKGKDKKKPIFQIAPETLKLEYNTPARRFHGPGCAVELVLLERHMEQCKHKKTLGPGRLPKEDDLGSYHVIHRIGFPSCLRPCHGGKKFSEPPSEPPITPQSPDQTRSSGQESCTGSQPPPGPPPSPSKHYPPYPRCYPGPQRGSNRSSRNSSCYPNSCYSPQRTGYNDQLPPPPRPECTCPKHVCPPGFGPPPSFGPPPGIGPPPGFRPPPGCSRPPSFHPPPGFASSSCCGPPPGFARQPDFDTQPDFTSPPCFSPPPSVSSYSCCGPTPPAPPPATTITSPPEPDQIEREEQVVESQELENQSEPPLIEPPSPNTACGHAQTKHNNKFASHVFKRGPSTIVTKPAPSPRNRTPSNEYKKRSKYQEAAAALKHKIMTNKSTETGESLVNVKSTLSNSSQKIKSCIHQITESIMDVRSRSRLSTKPSYSGAMSKIQSSVRNIGSKLSQRPGKASKTAGIVHDNSAAKLEASHSAINEELSSFQDLSPANSETEAGGTKEPFVTRVPSEHMTQLNVSAASSSVDNKDTPTTTTSTLSSNDPTVLVSEITSFGIFDSTPQQPLEEEIIYLPTGTARVGSAANRKTRSNMTSRTGTMPVSPNRVPDNRNQRFYNRRRSLSLDTILGLDEEDDYY